MFYIVLLTVTSIVTSDIYTLRKGTLENSDNKPEDGPFCTMYIDFFHEVHIKSRLLLKDIFAATSMASERFIARGDWNWLAPYYYFLQKFLIKEFQNKSTSEIKDEAKIFYDNMKNRRQHYNAEYNNIFDFFNEFVNRSETEKANEAISDFRDYPRVDKSPYRVCHDILEAFNNPFRRGERYKDFSNMVDFTVELLKEEYPEVFLEDEKETGATSSHERDKINLRISLFLT